MIESALMFKLAVCVAIAAEKRKKRSGKAVIPKPAESDFS